MSEGFYRMRGRELHAANSANNRKVGRAIQDMRDVIKQGAQAVSPDDIETLFYSGNETLDVYNYADFFVLLKEACFCTKNPDFEKFNQEKIYSMLDGFLHHFAKFIDQCNGIQAVMILFSLAKIGYDRNVEMIYSLLDRAAKKISRLDMQTIANYLWAAAVLGKTDYPSVGTFVEAARSWLENLAPEDTNDSYTIDQLYRFHFVSKALPEVEDLFSRLPLPDENGRWGVTNISKAQKHLYNQVCTALPPQTEITLGKFIQEIRCELDIAVECGKLRFDIECDGPHHVFRRLADKLNDDMKRAMGWEVFRIDTRNSISNAELNEKIEPIISEIRRKVADVIPDIFAHESAAQEPAPAIAPVPLSARRAETRHTKQPDAEKRPRVISPQEQQEQAEIADSAFQQAQLICSLNGSRGGARVYVIASHLGIESHILIQRMRDWGIDVANHMSMVSFQNIEITICRILKGRAIDRKMDELWKSLGVHPKKLFFTDEKRTK